MDMNLNDQLDVDVLLDENVEVGAAPRRNPRLPQMMRRIPVTLTLEVGSARISLQDLMDLGPSSVLPLDAVAGEPLVIKVNGAADRARRSGGRGRTVRPEGDRSRRPEPGPDHGMMFSRAAPHCAARAMRCAGGRSSFACRRAHRPRRRT
jgi:flagellar motor switch protein FliN/FliY